MSQQVDELRVQIQDSRNRRRGIKDELRNLSRAVNSLKTSLPKLMLEIEGCDTTRGTDEIDTGASCAMRSER
jgi:uncharacterized coiled-coil DUF342 family protein